VKKTSQVHLRGIHSIVAVKGLFFVHTIYKKEVKIIRKGGVVEK
jgi:hypothetical protein